MTNDTRTRRYSLSTSVFQSSPGSLPGFLETRRVFLESGSHVHSTKTKTGDTQVHVKEHASPVFVKLPGEL